MTTLAAGIRYVDIGFRATSGIIATAVLDGGDGPALIDPGPASCLSTLEARLDHLGIGVADLRAVLLTHIHLDHAGATGSLAARNRDLRVYVHERGAPHMIDPTKLIASATRLYGPAMDELWGPFLPVPSDRVTSLSGGERLLVAGRTFQVAYTPGHASHHVAFFDPESRVAFVGDTAGMRLRPGGAVVPPTPPPDIDLESWEQSIDLIRAWRAETLFVTHFGPVHEPDAHLSMLTERLQWVADVARRALATGSDVEAQQQLFLTEVMRAARRELTSEDLRKYELAGPFEHGFLGLARYWQKKGAS